MISVLYSLIIFSYELISNDVVAILRKIKSEKEFKIFWWNQLTGRTLVLNARFGAWSKKAVIISLGGLPSRSRDYFNNCFFLHLFLNFYGLYKNQNTKDPPNLRESRGSYSRVRKFISAFRLDQFIDRPNAITKP